MMYFFKFFGMFDQYLLLSFILEVTEVKITFVALLILLYNMQITKCHGCLLQVLVMLDAVIFLLYAFLAVKSRFTMEKLETSILIYPTPDYSS